MVHKRLLKKKILILLLVVSGQSKNQYNRVAVRGTASKFESEKLQMPLLCETYKNRVSMYFMLSNQTASFWPKRKILIYVFFSFMLHICKTNFFRTQFQRANDFTFSLESDELEKSIKMLNKNGIELRYAYSQG